MCNGTVRRLKLLLVASAAAAFLSATAAPVSAGPPAAGPGEPGCLGKDTAGFAQDWKAFPFEPPGVAPLLRFYGGSSPSEWLQGERQEDCTAA
jgi:hypothetical protein